MGNMRKSCHVTSYDNQWTRVRFPPPPGEIRSMAERITKERRKDAPEDRVSQVASPAQPRCSAWVRYSRLCSGEPARTRSGSRATGGQAVVFESSKGAPIWQTDEFLPQSPERVAEVHTLIQNLPPSGRLSSGKQGETAGRSRKTASNARVSRYGGITNQLSHSQRVTR